MVSFFDHLQIDPTARPRYAAIADALAEGIRNGALPADSKLPAHRVLAWQLRTTPGTIAHAYRLLEERGLVTAAVGRGTFVRAGGGGGSEPLREPQQNVIYPGERPSGIDLSRNAFSSHGMGPYLRESLRHLSETAGAEALNYMRHDGAPMLKAAGRSWMARIGLNPTEEQIVCCNGAHHGLSLCLGALARPGEGIFVEPLGYFGLYDMLAALRLRLRVVPADRQGMCPDALESQARRGLARILVLTPTLSNPLNATMSLARRRAIAEIARRYDLTIIEDDVYGYMPEHRPPPLAALAGERCIHVTSISKVLAAGLRSGWIAAPPRYGQAIGERLRALTLALPLLDGLITARWLNEGFADKTIAARRALLKRRAAMAREELGEHGVICSEGALHCLLPLPSSWEAGDFARAAARRGVLVTPLSAFGAPGRQEDKGMNMLRLSIAAPPRDEDLHRALATVRLLLEYRELGRDAVI